jgi:hypothetical protein
LNQSLALGYSYSFSPTLLTEWRFGFVRYRVNVLPNGLGTSPAKDAGIPELTATLARVLAGERVVSDRIPRLGTTRPTLADAALPRTGALQQVLLVVGASVVTGVPETC